MATNKQAERFSGGNCLGQSSEPERNEENKFIFIRIMGGAGAGVALVRQSVVVAEFFNCLLYSDA